MEKPYRGQEPYVFLSYSHKDMPQALEIVETLQQAGYRVWYDEGIDPGTEWDENVARHVRGCDYFVALLSAQYLESSNCKDELNFARELEKPRLLVYLENIRLPDGMQMRLGRLQAIHKYRYKKADEFYEKLFQTEGMSVCWDASSFKSQDAQDVQIPKKEEPIVLKSAKRRVLVAYGDYGKNVSWEFDEDGTLMLKGFGRMCDIGIENETPWSIYRDNIRKVIVKNNITKIGREAFSGCSNLENVVLSSSVKEIGEYAFELCESLQKLQMPEGLEKIDQGAFAGCFALKFVKIPNGVREIEESAFSFCIRLNAVKLPEGLVGIREELFRYCWSLKNVKVPSSVRTINGMAFMGCKSLKEVEVPTRCEINSLAFESQTNVIRV